MSIKDLKKIIAKELILSKEVFLIGHNHIDLDAFGAMVGFSLIAKKYKRKVYLIIDDKEIEPATKMAINQLSTKLNIIKLREIKELMTKKSILVVLDTNKANMISAKDLIPEFKNTIVIDHHSKGEGTINNANIYIEEKATSTCEIISSLLYRYRIKIPKSYANVLLGGMILDTNNFTYKMTRKAFYYCYYLSTKGANMEEAQLYFKQDLEEYVERAKIVTNTKVNGEIAIATGQRGKNYKRQDLAKIADILLEFKGIKTAFAIGYLEKDVVGVSARSIKKIHAGKLMEKLGGGGSSTEAAAVIENESIKKVEQKILENIK